MCSNKFEQNLQFLILNQNFELQLYFSMFLRQIKINSNSIPEILFLGVSS